MTIRRVGLREWILASGSPRRREILTGLGLGFRTDPSRAEEPARRPGEQPSRYVVRTAAIKANEVAHRHKSGVIIGADTVVVDRDAVLGKPENRDEARRMLKRLSSRWHEVVTGVCLIDGGSESMRRGYRSSRVHFRRLSDKEIEWYLDTGEYRDKAGAYAIHGYASLFIDRIEGCYFNVVGFPVVTFERLCVRMGIDLIDELRKTPSLLTDA